MVVINEFLMTLDRRGVSPVVDVVQGDANTRAVKITLTAGSSAFVPPVGTAASVAFQKPDGKKGWYDKLPNGEPACTIEGNTVTAVLAPEMLNAAGQVDAVLILQDADLNQLATFGFTVQVVKNPAAGNAISNDYYNYTTMAEINAVIDEALAAFQKESASSATPIICEETGSVVTVENSSNRVVQGLTLYGKTTQDGTPTPETPVELVTAGAGGSIKVNVAGKNLYSGGDLFSIYVYRNITLEKPLLPGTYTLSAVVVSNDTNGTSSMVSFIDGNANGNNVNVLLKRNNRASVKVTLTAAVSTIRFCAGPDTSNSSGDTAEYTDIQIEQGSVATQFEPYKPIQTFTASTPNGLPGIPVTSGGNYTDENGQQWACDEIDFARGVYVQRVYSKVLDGTEYWYKSSTQTSDVTSAGATTYNGAAMQKNVALSKECLSAHFPYNGANKPGTWVKVNAKEFEVRIAWAFATVNELKAFLAEQYNAGNPVTIQYALLTPIETHLSAEELAQYAALHTNKPNTTVMNDAGVGMELAYVADTKLYIDNKFNELAAAIVNNA
jgi:hypothetical protein